MGEALNLTFRQRASWLAHVAKAVTQDHHTEMEAVFRPYLPNDAVIADVGAHAGQFARLFARMAPQGHVYSFEPTSYARSILAQTLAWRGVKTVSVWPVALSDAEGEVSIATPLKRSSALGFGLAHVTRDAPGARERVETVRALKLDTFVEEQNVKRLDFIKCDIEGWEYRFLLGARETLQRFKPFLFLELNDEHLKRAGDSAEVAFKFLSDLGYSAKILTPENTLTPVAAYQTAGDFLFSAR